MEQGKFGVNLKRTGVNTRGISSTTSTSRTTRTTASIHTPLKPANVSDLKAKFDSSKSGGGSGAGTSSSSGRSSPRSSGTTSPLSGASSPGHGSITASGKKTDPSLSIAATKAFTTSSFTVSAPKSTAATFSSDITSKTTSSSRDNGFPSRINITTTSSASETLTRILGNKLDEGKTERTAAGPKPWSAKGREGSPADTKTFSERLRTSRGSSLEKKGDSSSSVNRVEIPVQHVISSKTTGISGKSSVGSGLTGKSKSELTPGKLSGGQGVTTMVKTFQTSGSSSGPEKTTVTSGFSASKSSNQFKYSLDKNKPSSTANKIGTRTIVREIPVERVLSASNKTENSKAQRSNDRLRASLEKEKKTRDSRKAEEPCGKAKEP